MMMIKDNLGGFFNTRCKFRGLNKVFLLICSETSSKQHLQKRPEDSQGSTSQSDSLWSLEMSCSEFSQRTFLCAGRRRKWLVAVSMDLPRVSHAWPDFHLWLCCRSMAEQQMLFSLSLARHSRFSHHILVFKMGCYSRNGKKSGGL